MSWLKKKNSLSEQKKDTNVTLHPLAHFKSSGLKWQAELLPAGVGRPMFPPQGTPCYHVFHCGILVFDILTVSSHSTTHTHIHTALGCLLPGEVLPGPSRVQSLPCFQAELSLLDQFGVNIFYVNCCCCQQQSHGSFLISLVTVLLNCSNQLRGQEDSFF